jgi:hypothetical protein
VGGSNFSLSWYFFAFESLTCGVHRSRRNV